MTDPRAMTLRTPDVEALLARITELEVEVARQGRKADANLTVRLHRAEAEVARLTEEGRKDYEDMRRFQAKYIEADREVARLTEALRELDHIAEHSFKGMVSKQMVQHITRAALTPKEET